MTSIPFHNIEDLTKDLARGLTLYCQDGDIAKRLGASLQLQVVIKVAKLLIDSNDSDKLAPLDHLHRALMQLNWGISDEILKPKQWGRKAPVSPFESFARGRAGATTDLLIEENKRQGGRGDKEKAARRVAAALGYNWKEVAKWRDLADTASAANDPLAFQYRDDLKKMQAMFPAAPGKGAEWLIKRAMKP